MLIERSLGLQIKAGKVLTQGPTVLTVTLPDDVDFLLACFPEPTEVKAP